VEVGWDSKEQVGLEDLQAELEVESEAIEVSALGVWEVVEEAVVV